MTNGAVEKPLLGLEILFLAWHNLTADINSLVPQNHLLRKIDKCLDLKFVRELTEPLYRIALRVSTATCAALARLSSRLKTSSE